MLKSKQDLESKMKFNLKSLFRKPLKSNIFAKLSKLKDEMKASGTSTILRSKFDREFIEVSTVLLHERNASKSYVFIKQFADEFDEFPYEFLTHAEIVLTNGDSGIIGDLYRSFPWTDSRFYFKAKQSEQVGGIWSTFSTIDGLLIKNKDVFDKDYPVIRKYVLENGSDYECKTLAKVCDKKTLSVLEDRFLKHNNNVFEIRDFALQKGVNEEKFLSKLIEFGDIEDAVKVLDSKSDDILKKAKKSVDKAKTFIELCKQCGKEDLAREIKSNLKSVKISKKSELSQQKREEDREIIS